MTFKSQLDLFSNTTYLELMSRDPDVSDEERQEKIEKFLDNNFQEFVKNSDNLQSVLALGRKRVKISHPDSVTQRINRILLSTLMTIELQISEDERNQALELLASWTAGKKLSLEKAKGFFKFLDKIPPNERLDNLNLIKKLFGKKVFEEEDFCGINWILKIPPNERIEVMKILLDNTLRHVTGSFVFNFYQVIRWIPTEERKDAARALWKFFCHGAFLCSDSGPFFHKLEKISVKERLEFLKISMSLPQRGFEKEAMLSFLKGWLALPAGRRLEYYQAAEHLIQREFKINDLLRGVSLFSLDEVPEVCKLLLPIIEERTNNLFGWFGVLRITPQDKWEEVFSYFKVNWNSPMLCDQVNQALVRSENRLSLPENKELEPVEFRRVWCDFCRRELKKTKHKAEAIEASAHLVLKMKRFEIDESDPLIHEAILRLADTFGRYSDYTPHWIYKKQFQYSKKPFPEIVLDPSEVCGETVAVAPRSFVTMDQNNKVSQVLLRVINKQLSLNSEFVIQFSKKNHIKSQHNWLLIRNIVAPKVGIDSTIRFIPYIEQWSSKVSNRADKGLKEFFEYLTAKRLVELYCLEADEELTEQKAFEILKKGRFLN